MSVEPAQIVPLPERRSSSRHRPHSAPIPSWQLLVHRARQLRAREVRWRELAGDLATIVVIPKILQLVLDVVHGEPTPVLVRLDQRRKLRRRAAAEQRRRLRRAARQQRRELRQQRNGDDS